MLKSDALAREAIISIKKTFDSAKALELLAEGANVNYIEPLERRTLLHEAATFNFTELAEQILSRPETDIMIRDGRNMTAAEIAESQAYFELAATIRRREPA